MASTMPSATAWRARSALVQWVICSPSATGSKQANSTIWARWRGGNLLRAAQAGIIEQEFRQAALFVAAAHPPDRGRVAFQSAGDGLDRFTSGNGQDDACVLDLEPGQTSATGNRFKDGDIGGSERQRARLASTHRPPPKQKSGSFSHHTPTRNFLHDFLAGPLACQTALAAALGCRPERLTDPCTWPGILR